MIGFFVLFVCAAVATIGCCDASGNEDKTFLPRSARSFTLDSDLYEFLVQPSEDEATAGQVEVCLGTLIHPDAFVTSAHCRDQFSVGTAVELFADGERGIVRSLSTIPPPQHRHQQSTTKASQYSQDILLVFLETESLSSTAIWKSDTLTGSDHHGTTFMVSERNSEVTVDIVDRNTCHAAALNAELSFPDSENLLCASLLKGTSASSEAALGAPLLHEDTAVLLGLHASTGRPDFMSDSKDNYAMWFASIDGFTESIDKMLCVWSRIPLPSCPSHPESSTPHQLLSTTRRTGLLARVAKWLKKKFGPSPPPPPPPPPPTPPPVTPIVPSVTATPSFEPTSFTIPPTNVLPTKRPTLKPPTLPPRAPIKSPTTPQPIYSPVRFPTLPPKSPTARPLRPTRPPTRRPNAVPSRTPPTPPPTKWPTKHPTAAPTRVLLTCSQSSKCPGRNLMHKLCQTQCVAEANVRRKRKAGWRCGQCF